MKPRPPSTLAGSFRSFARIPIYRLHIGSKNNGELNGTSAAPQANILKIEKYSRFTTLRTHQPAGNFLDGAQSHPREGDVET